MNQIKEVRLPCSCAPQLPDFVIENCAAKQLPYHKAFEGVVLFADVSGFTKLCQRYASSDDHTASDLVDEFNTYLHPIIENVLEAKGDIYKFAGDAILAHWPVNNQESKEDQIQKVIDCALILKNKFCNYQTNIGSTLDIKSAITFGEYDLFLMSGQPESQRTTEYNEFPSHTNYYVCCGSAIKCVSACEQQCGSEDVVVDKIAWEMCTCKDRYKSIMFKGSNGKTYYNLLSSEIDKTKAKKTQYRCRITDSEFSTTDIYLHYSFLITPVRRKIAQREPVEYLSELRTVSILFARLEVADNISSTELLSKLQRILLVVHKEIRIMNGVVTKLLMFDKGLSFLCAFGLSGYKYTNDSERSLKAALILVHTLNENPNVQSCSVGVCTGVVFCGVVGHPNRCEYTVIGKKVNMAARLMVAYPNVVACDKDTFLKSGLCSSYFSELQPKELKGLRNVGVVRAFEGESQAWRGKIVDIIASPFPIIDRANEINTFLSIIQEQIDNPGNRYDCVAIVGEQGSGRSRLIRHFAEILTSTEYYRKTVKISFVSVGSDKKLTKFWTLQQLIFRLLDLKESKSSKILSILPRQRSYPQLLNHLFGTDYPKTALPPRSVDIVEEVITMTVDLVNSPYTTLDEHGINKITVLFIDNLTNIDDSSASFLMNIAKSKNCLLVYTLTDPTVDSNGNINEAVSNLTNMERTSKILLYAMSERYHSTIACQILQAGKISSKILDVIRKRGSGLPGRIANILNELELSGFIMIDNEGKRQHLIETSIIDSTEKFSEGLNEYLMQQVHDSNGTIKKSTNQSHLKRIVYLLADKDQALNAHIHSADPSLHVLFDRLPDISQRILKICSMIGLQFDSGCIMYALQPEDRKLYAKAITNLFAMKFIMCAYSKRSNIWWKRQDIDILINGCQCPLNPTNQCSNCVHMKFVTLSDIETASSYLVNEFRIDFLPKLIQYYEEQTYRCRTFCTPGIRRNSVKNQHEEHEMIHVVYSKRFYVWFRKMKGIVDRCRNVNEYHEMPELRDFLSAAAFRKDTTKDRYLSLKELDRLDRSFCRITLELEKCCKPSNSQEFPTVKVSFDAGIPFIAHRLKFEPFKGKIRPSINIFQLHNDKPHPFDSSLCRCSMEVSRGYKTLMQLCSNNPQYQTRYLYYALKSIHSDILLNEAFDARRTLEDIFRIISKQPNINDLLRAHLEYFNSVIAYRTKNIKKSTESSERALLILKVDCKTLLEIYKDKLNGFENRSFEEISLVGLLLIQNSRCYMKMLEYKRAYDIALMTIQILPSQSFIKIEAFQLCTICCYNLELPESIDFYYLNSNTQILQLTNYAGYEPFFVEHIWIFMVSFLVLGKVTHAIKLGKELLNISIKIKANEDTIIDISACLAITGILKFDQNLFTDMMAILEKLENKVWYSVLALDGCTCEEMIGKNEEIELNITQAVLHNQMYKTFQSADGQETKSMAKLSFIYANIVLMEINEKCVNMENAINYFKAGSVEILRTEEWGFIHIYCFVKLCLFQYRNNIDGTDTIPRLVHVYKDICKKIPMFYSAFASCIAYQNFFNSKKDTAIALLDHAKVAAEFMELPYLLKVYSIAQESFLRRKHN